jgi:hypothetical protein
MCPNQAKGNEFLMAIKIRSTTSFGGGVKPSVPCRKILRHVKNPYRYEKRYSVGNILKFLSKFRKKCMFFGTVDILLQLLFNVIT